MNKLNCHDGVCEVPESQEPLSPAVVHAGKRVIYVGDPMCSWCYGMAEDLAGLQEYCDTHDISFEIIMGGLRPGGGDPWNEQVKRFLRHEWEKVQTATGQPFAFRILDLDYFHYDTEPSCRAVVIARDLLPEDNQKSLARFLAKVQQKFYFENQDPKEIVFYQSICEALGVNYQAFQEQFESAKARQKTMGDFRRGRELGVRGFPSFVLINENEVSSLAVGYTSLQNLIRKIEMR